MTDEPEDDESEEIAADFGDSYPDTLSCQEGQIHFGGDAQVFLEHWMGKLGAGVVGAALIVGEGLSVAMIHPDTGESLTPSEIARKAKMRVVQ
jgi:hypothetical protein